MKFYVFAFLLVSLGLVSNNVAVEAPRSLESDLEDFLELLPTEKLVIILFKYLDDTEVQQTITYMFGNEFKSIIAELDSIDEFNAVVEYLDGVGIAVSTFFENLKEILGITRERKQPIADLGGFRGMLKEMSEAIDWEAMGELYDDKMENSEEFQKFIGDLTSEEFIQLWTDMVENPRMQEISVMLTAGGVDIGGLIRLLKEFFTSSPPTTTVY